MKKNIIYIVALFSICLTGCKEGEGFLDKNPDLRASIDTQEKVRLLLVDAYSDANGSALMEFSSDNIIDNNAPDAVGHTKSMVPISKMYDEIFAWKPVVSSDQQDSPDFVWRNHYRAIAVCNQALDAISELEAQGKDMTAEKSEALLSRAYHHFLLACIFCHAYKTDEASRNDLGLVYMTKPETTVSPEYHRASVTETYDNIEKDLEEGLRLMAISAPEAYYSVPKYHFNIKAAHAFAARFYLYKREWSKVLRHANVVLAGYETSEDIMKNLLFDNYNAHVKCTSVPSEGYAWVDPASPSNLLLMPSSSVTPYSNYPDEGRYQCAGDALNYTLLGAGPIWDDRALIRSLSIWSAGSDQYGSFLAKNTYFFEYTDKVNGYGFVHAITRHLTTNETLLCRAEAETMLGMKKEAIRDLRAWCLAYDINEEKSMSYSVNSKGDTTYCNLTQDKIDAFYREGNVYAPKLHNVELGFDIPEDAKTLLWCCLHFRRIENIHDGWRWMDLKRYGIEIKHIVGLEAPDVLTWDDPRRAIQLPQTVLVAGLEPNPRNGETTDTGTSTLHEDNVAPAFAPANDNIFTRITE
ncbi:MAG: RagB/SusD family nutrient uptake outer membrane protein [Paludibacteraceae bacterium]|nr:RagB/SusD family nutrient uptake outer membrane protein [Paludibacteraceae bacterium]